MKLWRVLLMIALSGAFAFSSLADSTDPSSTDTSGSVADPVPHIASPDGCNPPYVVCFEYTGTSTVYSLFIPASPDPTPEPPLIPYCTYTDDGFPGLCLVDTKINDGTLEFEGITITSPCILIPNPPYIDCFPITTDTTFDLSVAGTGPITFGAGDDTNLCVLVNGVCNPDMTTMTADPVPEPGTGLLFVTGLLLVSLARFARKRFAAAHATQAVLTSSSG
jgi:hypothetical protein